MFPAEPHHATYEHTLISPVAEKMLLVRTVQVATMVALMVSSHPYWRLCSASCPAARQQQFCPCWSSSCTWRRKPQRRQQIPHQQDRTVAYDTPHHTLLPPSGHDLFVSTACSMCSSGSCGCDQTGIRTCSEQCVCIHDRGLHWYPICRPVTCLLTSLSQIRNTPF